MHISRTIIVSILVASVLGFGASAKATPAALQSTSASRQQRDFTVILAKAELSAQGVTPENTSEINYKIALGTAVKEISAQRNAGLGWGEIANKMGLNWGKVVSDARHSRNALRATKMHSDTARDQSKDSEKANGVKGSDGHANGASAEKK